MSEMEKLEIERQITDIKLFDAPKRIREALEGLKKEFQEYDVSEIDIGIELGFPTGVKGTLSTKLVKGK